MCFATLSERFERHWSSVAVTAAMHSNAWMEDKAKFLVKCGYWWCLCVLDPAFVATRQT